MSQSTNPQARLLKAVDEAFEQFPSATATIEALLPLVSKKFGRSVIAPQLRSLLNKYPTRYRQDDAARWSLLQTIAGIEEHADIPLDKPNLQLVEHLRSGTYVIFDLETMGEWK